MKPDIYYYEDTTKREFRIGTRGYGKEIVIPYWDIVRAGDSFRLREGRNWTNEEALEWAIKWAERESQYVDFEEVEPNNILLGLGNSGINTNQTK